MIVKDIIWEDFVNYFKPSMFIITPTCSFKCDKECGKPVCQNSELAKAPTIDIDNEEIIEQWLIKNDDVHTEGTNIRNEVSPKVNNVLLKMMYELNADRVCVLEMHNGKENPTSLPFIYCDMTYEETRGKTPYVSEEYENLNMSKFTFPTYLWKNRYFSGD